MTRKSPSSSGPGSRGAGQRLPRAAKRRGKARAPAGKGTDYRDLLYEVEAGIATITLNRPERMNAFSPAMEAELHRAFDQADADRAVKVIVLTGRGIAFCAGYNLEPSRGGRNSLDPAGKTMAEFLEYWHRHDGSRVAKWTHMWRLGKPIIAAVNGWAMGAGFWYQLAADITLASEKVVFAQPEIRHVSNSSYLLTALCGWKAANRWALTGDHFDAQEALRIGMVNQVVAHENLISETRALARRIALVPEPSLRLNKAIAMLGMQAAGLHAGLLLEGTLSTLAHASHDAYREKLLRTQLDEGMKAFLHLRDGPFQPEPMGPRSAKDRQESAKTSGSGKKRKSS